VPFIDGFYVDIGGMVDYYCLRFLFIVHYSVTGSRYAYKTFNIC